MSFSSRADWITALLMSVSTECTAALLSFRYPSLDKSVVQTENDVERGFVKQGLNSVEIIGL